MNVNYITTIPEALASAIEESAQAVSKKRNADYEPWVHGLPMWRLSIREERTNLVLIEAINLNGVPSLSFTPDAFEDANEGTDWGRLFLRKTPSPEAVLGGRRVLTWRELTSEKSATPSFDSLVIEDHILSALSAAEELPLVEILTLRFVPHRSEISNR